MRAALFCAAAALAAAACDPQLYAAKKAEPAAAKPDKPEPDNEPPPSPSPFGMLGALNHKRAPGPFDEPTHAGGAPYTAIVELRGHVVEIDAPFSLSLKGLSGGGDSVTLRAIVERLHKLDADKDVSAILLRLGDVEMPLATAEELRATIAKTVKPVTCHAEQLSNTGYLVASACGKVVLEPGGQVLFNGPALVPIYLKGLLDLLSVKADFVHMGAYKGAAEPLTRSEPSKEMRQTYDDIAGGAYARLVSLVAEGRHVGADKVAAWIDEGLFSAEAARAAGLVDKVQPFVSLRGSTYRKVRVKDEKGGLDDLMTMLGLAPKPRVRGPHVALMYAVGEVVDGRGGVGGPFEEIASGRLAPALFAASLDDDVKAIVLRVDSPGGSAIASEVILKAVLVAAEAKPVVVSMGGLAASGGYYISVGARRIFAQPDSLTGSIGVVGGKIVIGAALARVGVTTVEIGRGKRAGLFSPMRPWTDEERAAITKLMAGTYDLFVSRVAFGRKLKPEVVEQNAQGRVFTGADALERKLVDEIGGLDDALAYARDQAKLPADAPIEVYPGEPTLLDWLGGMSSAKAGLEVALAAVLPDDALLGPAASSLRATLRLLAHFDGQPVRAVAFLPAWR